MEGLTETVSDRLTADAEDVRFAPGGLNKAARRVAIRGLTTPAGHETVPTRPVPSPLYHRPMKPITKSANSLLRRTEEVSWRGSPVKGIWVGGRVNADDHGVAFAPNAMNKSMHPVDTTWQMEYAEIRRVRVRYGVGTKIVELHGDDRVATFRCFGARRVAAEIAQRATAPLEG